MAIRKYEKGIKRKLSKNFYSTEFDCHCKFEHCKETHIDDMLASQLQSKRSQWGAPLKVNSGFRCDTWNKIVGGAKNSQHKTGRAADIIVYGMTPKQVADACEDFNGLGRYKTFTHVDVRKKHARWGKN